MSSRFAGFDRMPGFYFWYRAPCVFGASAACELAMGWVKDENIGSREMQ